MDFSEALGGLRPVQSPNGKLIASIDKYNLCIRESESLDVVARFVCLDAITQAIWSPDSELILCAQSRRKIVQVWSVSDPDWTCKIDESVAGLASAMWSPDSRHILTVTEFQLRITIWSLLRRSVSYIKFPKFATSKGIAFSPNNKFLAVLERDQSKDYISLYYLDTWEQVNVFALETEDAVEIQWSSDSHVILVVDACTTYGVLAYTPEGRRLVNYKAYTGALGVKVATMSSKDTFIAVGSYDDKLRLVNSITWQPTAVLSHPVAIQQPSAVNKRSRGDGIDNENGSGEGEGEGQGNHPTSEEYKGKEFRSIFDRVIVYREVTAAAAAENLSTGSDSTARLMDSQNEDGSSALSKSTHSQKQQQQQQIVQTLFEIDTLPITLKQQSSAPSDPSNADPSVGICSIEWSSFGEHYVATRSDTTPHAVWIWDVLSLKLHSLLITISPIRSMRWDPCSYRLAVCCGNDKLYLWSPEAASVVSVPVIPPPVPAAVLAAVGTVGSTNVGMTFCVRSINWFKNGNAMILSDRDAYTVCYFRE